MSKHLKVDEVHLRGTGVLSAIATLKKAKLLSRAADVIGKTAGAI